MVMNTSIPKASVLLLNHYNRLSPRVELEIKALWERGYRVHVLFWERLDESVPSKAQFYECSVVRFPAPRGSLKLLLYLPAFYRAVMRHLQALEKRFDVVHCTHIMLLPLAVWLKRRWRAAAIYDVYEFHLHETAERLPWFLRWIVFGMRKLEDQLVRWVDGVLTVDSAGEELARRYGALQPNTAVLHNVPEAYVKLDKGKLEALKARYSEREVVLHIGGISEAKGAIAALEAARLVAAKRPQVLFLFIGRFQTDAIRELFQQKLTEYKLDRYVEWVPWLPYSEMLHYVTISSVGLALYQPTTRYLRVGRGARKLFTYMQFGVPIVGPKFGKIGKILWKEGCGLQVDTTDPQEVAKAVLHLLEHPNEAWEIGKRGRKAIQERYNWEIEKQKLLSVYEQALQKGAHDRLHERSTQTQDPP